MLVVFAVVLIAAVGNALLTSAGLLAPLDHAATVAIYRFEPSWLVPLMVALTLLSDDPPLDLFALAVAAWAWRKRERTSAISMVGVALAARVLGVVMKAVVRRPRPLLFPPPSLLPVLHGYGYPSGNALLATAILGFGAVLLIQWRRSTAARWLVALVCAVLILGVGWSRVFLGFHWVNDVVGGYLDGGVLALAGGLTDRCVRCRIAQRV